MDGKLIGLVRDTVIDRYGEALWTSLAGCAGDAEAAPSDALACWIGRESVPTLRETYPSLFDRHSNLVSFIGGLGDELPAASTDRSDPVRFSLRHASTPDGSILLRIEADCSLCALLQGVIAGAAVHYGEAATISEIKSPRRGDNVCLLQIEVGDESVSPDLGSRDRLAVM